jgi:hypothetical protein
LWIKPTQTNIDDFRADDFELIGYQSHKRISMKMACKQNVQLWSFGMLDEKLCFYLQTFPVEISNR